MKFADQLMNLQAAANEIGVDILEIRLSDDQVKSLTDVIDMIGMAPFKPPKGSISMFDGMRINTTPTILTLAKKAQDALTGLEDVLSQIRAEAAK